MNTRSLVVLVTGTRETLTDEHERVIHRELQCINDSDHGFQSVLLVHGGCTGVDTYCASVGKQMGWTCIPFKVQWDVYGKRARPIRNQEMIDKSHPHIALAFPTEESIGTRDCIRRVTAYRDSTYSRLKYMKEITLIL